jgi:hypothetical protein
MNTWIYTYTPPCPDGIVFNKLSTGTTLPFYVTISGTAEQYYIMQRYQSFLAAAH